MNEKVVHEKCIGYQRTPYGLDSIFEQKLEDGSVQYVLIRRDKKGNEHLTLPTREKPRIDIVEEGKSE